MDSMDKLQNLYKAEKVNNPWAVARAIVDGTAKKVSPLWQDHVNPNASEDEKRSLMGKIVAGIENNPWNKDANGDAVEVFLNKISSYSPENADEQHKTSPRPAKNLSKKIDPALAALGGWWFGGTVRDLIDSNQPTPAQQREFERQIRQQMRRGVKKDQTMDQLKSFYKDSSDTYIRRKPPTNGVDVEKDSVELSKILPTAPQPGMIFNVVSRRWQNPQNLGQEVIVRGGKKRIRGTGTGVHERSVSGHGKGRTRGEAAGRVGRSRTTDIAIREKRGTIHGKSTATKAAESGSKKHRHPHT